jgi:acyl-coenzyme A thioesterase PaaI-like protein
VNRAVAPRVTTVVSGAVSRPNSALPPPDAEIPSPHPQAPPPGSRLDSHYARCFGCGDGHDTGLRMRVTVGEGLTVHAAFTVTEDHQGAPGLAHGGLLSAAVDEALGSLFWLLRTPAVTGRLETEFLRPVPVGATLHLTARCVGVSGRRVFTQAEGRLDAVDGRPALRATAVFVTVQTSHFRTHGRAVDVAAAAHDADVAAAARTFEVNP